MHFHFVLPLVVVIDSIQHDRVMMTPLWSSILLLLVALQLLTTGSWAFVVPQPSSRVATRIFLEDWVANMIDQELYRQNHKKEFENEWMEKNRQTILQQLRRTETMTTIQPDDDERQRFQEYRRDQRMAAADPARYCADRCITTGNCDVFEDEFDFTPEEVMAFCEECVLVDTEDPEHDHCNVPEAFYDMDTLKP